MAEKFEKIGNVTLDLTYYQGDDKYSDGVEIEDEILEAVKNTKPEKYPELIEEKGNWTFFYHLSQYRANIIDWLPFRKSDRVLEIGSGCGAITETLAKRAGSVTCIDLSKKRSMINAYRNQKYDNVTIMVGNFQDIEPHLANDYDYVLLVGVFEYGASYIGGKTPYEDFMAICNKHRSSNGRMIIAIENKFGLKYWAGCREDHLGTFFSGIEGYPNGGHARTFTKRGLEEIAKKVGIAQYYFYYPYPDYKFATTIYSDRYLPKKGELANNIRNFDRDRMICFDEKLVFDQIIEENEFPLFSNSYLLVIGNELETIYSKFSNDRAKPWSIRTSICQSPFGELRVEKAPCAKSSVAHIENTFKAYEKLSKRYAGTKIVIDPCKMQGDTLVFEFCKGKTLEELLDECLANADVDGFKSLIDEYITWLNYGSDHAISNIDFIFPNIIVDGDKWQVIDYEWTFERQVPMTEIAFRAFYNYLLGSESRSACEDLLYRDTLNLTDDEIKAQIEDEKEFQKYITGQRASVAEMREKIGNEAWNIVGVYGDFIAKRHSQNYSEVFYDTGNGFNAEQRMVVKHPIGANGMVDATVTLPENVKNLRIDPSSMAGIVEILELKTENGVISHSEINVNGVWLNDRNVIFATEDPNIVFPNNGAKTLSFKLKLKDISLEDAKLIESGLINKQSKKGFKRG